MEIKENGPQKQSVDININVVDHKNPNQHHLELKGTAINLRQVLPL